MVAKYLLIHITPIPLEFEVRVGSARWSMTNPPKYDIVHFSDTPLLSPILYFRELTQRGFVVDFTCKSRRIQKRMDTTLLLPGITQRTIKTDRLTVAYLTTGAGEIPIVLVHGNCSSSLFF